MWPDGTISRGTGFVIAPRLVVTAAHVVFKSERRWRALSVQVVPNADGATAVHWPLGSYSAREVRLPIEYSRDNDINFDYAAVVMPDYSMINAMPNLQFWTLTEAPTIEYRIPIKVHEHEICMYSYPGDKARGTQWYSPPEKIVMLPNPRFAHKLDTEDGSSGAPLHWHRGDGSFNVIGIHSGTSDNRDYNIGIRITEPIRRQIMGNWNPDA